MINSGCPRWIFNGNEILISNPWKPCRSQRHFPNMLYAEQRILDQSQCYKVKTVQTPNKWKLHMWGAFCYQLPLSAKCSGAKSHWNYSSFDQHERFQSTVELEKKQENELWGERKREERNESQVMPETEAFEALSIRHPCISQTKLFQLRSFLSLGAPCWSRSPWRALIYTALIYYW